MLERRATPLCPFELKFLVAFPPAFTEYPSEHPELVYSFLLALDVFLDVFVRSPNVALYIRPECEKALGDANPGPGVLRKNREDRNLVLLAETERLGAVVSDGGQVFEKVFVRKVLTFSAVYVEAVRPRLNVFPVVRCDADVDFFERIFQGAGLFRRHIEGFTGKLAQSGHNGRGSKSLQHGGLL